MQKLLTVLMTLLLVTSLTACQNKDVEVTPTPTPTSKPVETTETEDDVLYVPVGSNEIDFTQLALPLDFEYSSYEVLPLNEDETFDYNTQGEYQVKLLFTDLDGKKIEQVKTIIVEDEEEVIKHISEKKRNAKVDVAKTENEPKVNNDGKTETIENTDVPETSPKPTEDVDNSNNTNNTNNETSETTSNNSWNGGLSTNASDYGLDSSNTWVSNAMNYVGTEGLCSTVAGSLVGDVGMGAYEYKYSSSNWSDISACLNIGDWVTYYGLNGTSIQHDAIYLGNGLALHGNWTGGVARIAPINQVANSYDVMSHFESTCATGNDEECEDCNVTDSQWASDWREEKAEINTDICKIKKLIDMTDTETFACMDKYELAEMMTWEINQ